MEELIKNITQAELERAISKGVVLMKRDGERPRLVFPNSKLYSKEALVKKATLEIIISILEERRKYIENYEGDGNGFENF